MDDSDLFDQSDAKIDSSPLLVISNESANQSINQQVHSGQIIIRTLMQKTVFKIYPNGDMFIDKAQCKAWFTDSREVYKPKREQKAQPIQKIITEKEENY